MHQLHIFVFFLAVFHVTFSFFTMSLGRAKVWWALVLSWFFSWKRSWTKVASLQSLWFFVSTQTRIWKVWEKETCLPTYEFHYGTVLHYFFLGWMLFHMQFIFLYAKIITLCKLVKFFFILLSCRFDYPFVWKFVVILNFCRSLKVQAYSSNIFCEATCKQLEQKHSHALCCKLFHVSFVWLVGYNCSVNLRFNVLSG